MAPRQCGNSHRHPAAIFNQRLQFFEARFPGNSAQSLFPELPRHQGQQQNSERGADRCGKHIPGSAPMAPRRQPHHHQVIAEGKGQERRIEDADHQQAQKAEMNCKSEKCDHKLQR